MIRKIILIMMIGMFGLLTWSPLLSAREVSGVEIPESLDLANIPLLLNGAGIRSMLFFDIYVSALYLEFRSQDAEKILRDDMPMGVRLHIVSGFMDSDDMQEAITDGFSRSTGGNTQPIESQLKRFLELINEEVVKGDYFDFIYLPEIGLKIYKNSTFLEDIKGLNFKRAFFGIWLGDDPVDDDLKEEMLGL